jgi:hypothetical protein
MAAAKANAVELQLEYALLASDEDDGVRTLEEIDITGLTLKPTAKARAQFREADALSEPELRRKCWEVQREVALGSDLFAKWRNGTLDPGPPEPVGPTDDDLREQAKALGLRLRPTVRQKARDDMHALFANAERRAA